MKKVILLLLLSTIAYSQEGVKLIGGFYSGMSKKEAKVEFKENKDTYINIQLGSPVYKYRMYIQNHEYDENGLVMVGFTPKGTGLGMLESSGKDYFRDLVEFLLAQGYVAEGANVNNDNYFEFSNDNSWYLVNKDKTKQIKIFTMPYLSAGMISFNVWIGLYDGNSEDYSNINSILD